MYTDRFINPRMIPLSFLLGDDAGVFCPRYVASEKEGGKAIFKADPFQSLDQSGVGMLVQMGIKKGRSTNPDLKVGICGEHGGEAESVKFCHRVGMNYVSASPYRVPIARLAARRRRLRIGRSARIGSRASGQPVHEGGRVAALVLLARPAVETNRRPE